MQHILIDLLLCGFIYAVLLTIILVKDSRRRKRKDSDGDDDGGLPVMTPPEIDLPPGVCLPDDPRVRKKEPEEVFA